MSELVIKVAINNGDLVNDESVNDESVNDYKAITLFDALRNTDVIKRYNEQYKKEFGVPSCFDKVSRSEKT